MALTNKNEWITFVKKYSNDHGIPYNHALKQASPSYQQSQNAGAIKTIANRPGFPVFLIDMYGAEDDINMALGEVDGVDFNWTLYKFKNIFRVESGNTTEFAFMTHDYYEVPRQNETRLKVGDIAKQDLDGNWIIYIKRKLMMY
jgi:hypothetical protein